VQIERAPLVPVIPAYCLFVSTSATRSHGRTALDANVSAVGDILQPQTRFVVPVYQRPYVWEREKQWEPLWSDVLTLVAAHEAGEARDHFLGAIVLQQELNNPTELPRRILIDGQQRMTTLQLLFAAAGFAAREMGAEAAAVELLRCVRNGVLAPPGEELKLSPTEIDRAAFELVMAPDGPPPDAEDDPNNHVQEAFEYFLEVTREFGVTAGTDQADTLARFTLLARILVQRLRVVTINLTAEDDAQLIFETLNARGTPLLEIDNVKNALLHLASRQHHDVERLHAEVWLPELGDPYWRDEVRQGRLVRPRAEVFLNHWLTMELNESVASTKLFPTFRARVLDTQRGTDAASLLTELCEDAAVMRRLWEAPEGTSAARLMRALRKTDTTTALPLVLLLHRLPNLSGERRDRAQAGLEAYIVRRMLLGLTTKAYNRIFVEAMSKVRQRPDEADDVLLRFLAASGGRSARWPLSEELVSHLLGHPIYHAVTRARLEYVLWELELVMRSGSKTEELVHARKRLSIEHVIPQSWSTHWPLPDASDEEIEERRSLIHVLGNLTLVTKNFNSSLSNSAWMSKRKSLPQHSLLLMNSRLAALDTWDESAIRARGLQLAEMIADRWPGPEAMLPDFDPQSIPHALEEMSPGNAMVQAEDIAAVWSQCSPLMRLLLEDLATADKARRTYAEVEDSLGWTRGQLASVLGGYGNFAKERFQSRRPFRIARDDDGEWWMWVDDVQTTALAELARSVHAP